MPLLTVVMPCRNAMPRLERALEAARRALAGQAFELIAADGGSTDGTLEILRREDLHLIEGPDASLYEGLNKAVAAASGDYVLWVNADDVLLPGISELLEAARSTDADMATGECEISVGNELIWQSRNAANAMTFASVLFAVPTINCRLFKTQVLRNVGPFRAELGLAADREMLLRLLDFARHRVVLPEAVYRYESHSGSRTMGRTWTSYDAVHRANAALARVIEKRGTHHERRLAGAFGLRSALALARALLASGRPIAGLETLFIGLGSHPDPRLWLAGLDLHRRYRGRSSGW